MSGDIAVPGYVEVRLHSIARNYAKLRDTAAGTEVGAVVKADAYGLGAARIASFLFEEGCRRFFVATLEEGVALRNAVAAGTGADIYVFEGLRGGAEKLFVEHALLPVLNTRGQVESWLDSGAPCAVHVDTGMSRLGIGPEEFTELFAEPSMPERLGMQFLMTHLACADEPEHPQNLKQLEAFDVARRCVGEIAVSIANSAGAFLDRRFHGDLVRAGIALYGGNPFATAGNPMEAVATLFARVLQIRELQTEATVGYGATHSVPAGSRTATVGVGYADGYPRILGNAAQASFRGTRVPVIGRVSMDLTCLDVSEIDPAGICVGDFVEMFGDHVPVDEIAGLSSTISYEILTGLNARLPRVYME